MQNKALENTVYVLAAGAFGVFLRWLQLQLAFDENGLCGPSIFNFIVPIFLIAAAWLLHRRIRQTLGSRYTLPKKYNEALSNPGKLYAFLRWLLGAMMAMGGVLLIRGSETEKHAVMLRVLGVGAILAGLAFSFYLELANREIKSGRRRFLCLMSLLPILLFAVWLVYDYMNNAINSVIWGFLIEVLTVSTLMLAFFRLAGFAYGQVNAEKTLFWLEYGILMSLVVLADERSTSMQIIFFSAGMMLALAQFILLRRVREKTEEETASEEKKEEDAEPDKNGFDTL